MEYLYIAGLVFLLKERIWIVLPTLHLCINTAESDMCEQTVFIIQVHLTVTLCRAPAGCEEPDVHTSSYIGHIQSTDLIRCVMSLTYKFTLTAWCPEGADNKSDQLCSPDSSSSSSSSSIRTHQLFSPDLGRLQRFLHSSCFFCLHIRLGGWSKLKQNPQNRDESYLTVTTKWI